MKVQDDVHMDAEWKPNLKTGLDSTGNLVENYGSTTEERLRIGWKIKPERLQKVLDLATEIPRRACDGWVVVHRRAHFHATHLYLVNSPECPITALGKWKCLPYVWEDTSRRLYISSARPFYFDAE